MISPEIGIHKRTFGLTAIFKNAFSEARRYYLCPVTNLPQDYFYTVPISGFAKTCVNQVG